MGYSVLLVDDDVEMLGLFRTVLERLSFDVHLARTALDALDVLLTRNVAIVVTDERMPGMTGTALLAQVQGDFPRVVRIMLTGAASVTVAQRAINEGRVFRFLTKPVRPSELVATLREAAAVWEQAAGGGPEPVAIGHPDRRAAEMRRLEREWRGLTRVERDADGAVVVAEDEIDPDVVLREMQDRPHGPTRLH